MNLKKVLCTVLSVLLMLNLFVSFSYAEMPPYDDYEKNSLWIIYGPPERFDEVFKNNIYFARLELVEKWEKIKEQIEWEENGQIAYKKDNVRILDKYFTDTDINKNIVKGDLNNNGETDVGDARIALRLAVGLDEPTKELTLEKVDVSVNDKIDVEDARLILRIAVGLERITSYRDLHFFIFDDTSDQQQDNQ